MSKPAAPGREKCRCIHYDDDGEGWDCCTCGHNREFHRPSKRYPGDMSCKADETEDDDAD